MGQKRYIKFSSIFLLTLLVFHFSMVTYTLEWLCECDKHTEKMTCCCNCPKCVEARGGLLSYCHFRSHSHPEGHKAGPAFTPPSCTCGSGKGIFNLTNDVPFVPPSNLHYFSTVAASSVKVANSFLKLEELILSRDHPG